MTNYADNPTGSTLFEAADDDAAKHAAIERSLAAHDAVARLAPGGFLTDHDRAGVHGTDRTGAEGNTSAAPHLTGRDPAVEQSRHDPGSNSESRTPWPPSRTVRSELSDVQICQPLLHAAWGDAQ